MCIVLGSTVWIVWMTFDITRPPDDADRSIWICESISDIPSESRNKRFLVSGHAPIFHLLTGHLLTDICWLDICWLGLDICWLRHLLILATPAICWLWKDVCWFRHLLIQTIADSVKTHISAFTTAATFPKLPISGTMEVLMFKNKMYRKKGASRWKFC